MRVSYSEIFNWVNHDALLMMTSHSLRNFSRNLLTVLMAIYLDEIGFSLIQIGAFISAGIMGSALYTVLVAFFADLAGRRLILVVLTLLRATVGLSLVITDNAPFLILLSFFGAHSTGGAGGAGVLSLELASLAATVPSQRRTQLFALYSIAGTTAAAVGALAAGLPDLYGPLFDLTKVESLRIALIAYSAVLILAAISSGMLSSAVEAGGIEQRWSNPLRLPSRGRILSLSGLFAIDHFAEGLIVQSLVSLWFFTQFQVSISSLGLLFSLSQLAATVSALLATQLAKRFGLINTMVLTHFQSNVLLFLLPFLPTFWMALICWLGFSLLARMSEPLRQSYSMGIVDPSERVAMATANTLGRSSSSSLAPSLSTALWSASLFSLPFFSSSILKMFHDVALYLTYRNVRPPEEKNRITPSNEYIQPNVETNKP